MSDGRIRTLRERIDALTPAQRRTLAESLARNRNDSRGNSDHGRREGERLVAFVVVDGASPPTDDELRGFLGERLPDYMVPSRFVAVERLPRTSAGKLDRKSLAYATGHELGSRLTDRRPTPPRTELEAKVAAIWKDVLKIDDVGVDDDFFEIGGDSLLSIRVISRAGRAGIRIAPERFFERPTIADIAAGIAAGETPRAATNGARGALADPVGDAPLSPIQHWFLDAIPQHRDRWNQSYLLELGHALDATQFRAIVHELVTHHDALRLRLTRRDAEWRQDFVAADDDTPFRMVDLVGVPETAYLERVVEECEREHSSLRVDDGRLFRGVVFEGRAGWRRILLLAHHLVLDSVSWSVILEDLATLVTQTASGEPLQLPARTAPARAWSIALAELAATPSVATAARHWLEIPTDRDPPSSIASREPNADTLADRGCNRDADIVTVTLDIEDSRALMQDVPRRIGAPAQAVVLAALLLAWRDWTGAHGLCLDLEGHGRDVLGEIFDVSRTVGWFTTVFPVHLELPSGHGNGSGPSPDAAVTAVRAALDALPLPLRGAAHGLARYLAPDESLRAALAARRRPAMLFNLLGTHDVTLPPASRLRVTDEPHGRPRSPDAARPYLLELNARVEGGALIVTIEYSRKAYDADAMAPFAEALRHAMQGMARGWSRRVALPGVDASSLTIVADLLAELDET